MFIRLVLVTTFLAFMSASYAAPTDRPLSPFHSLHLVFRARMPPFGVNLRRQIPSDNSSLSLSDFPDQCQQGCASAINAIITCPTTCVCNPTVDSSLAYCMSCSVNAEPTSSNIQDGQHIVDLYNNFCSGTGVSSISYTVTNTASGTSTNVTASISQTGTSTITSTSATASSTRNNASVIRPRAALTSIGLVMVLSIMILLTQ